MSTMKNASTLIGNEMEFLGYLKSRFPMYHQSTFFFRDVQGGVSDLLRAKGVHVRPDQAEGIAREIVSRFEKAKLFVPIDRQTWVVNHPDFRTPSTKQEAPSAAKPAPAAAAA
jgi:hypothetical protein